ncbi:DUF2147 domain-containing protein [Sphingomonas mesophila]|uniref:DUF2147 domain-containing protein n=1 Tax=Sphingomonas mesophila TaxID=2303576 RepID=UPI000E582EAE|nr:DUF2147 domain-containing protein [Sphingomonas mesophila]
MPTPVLLLAALFADGSLEGRWTHPNGSVTVAIAQCGEAWCGTVVAASDKAKADAAKGGTRDLVGTQLMTGFTAAGEDKWKGRLFVPDRNFRARAELRLLDSNRLVVRGCMAGKMLCKSQTWTRAD